MARDLLFKKFDGKPPREAPPPSKWGMSRTGTCRFTVRKVGFRNKRGEKLYRLGFHVSDDRGPLFSQQLWTLAELNAQGVVWLDKSPFAAELPEQPTDTVDVPKDAMPDDEAEEPEAVPVEEVRRRHPPEMMLPDAPPAPKQPAPPAPPETFEGNYGMQTGQVCYHVDSGKPYRILGIVDANTARVEEVAEDGVKRPARNMRGVKLQKVKP